MKCLRLIPLVLVAAACGAFDADSEPGGSPTNDAGAVGSDGGKDGSSSGFPEGGSPLDDAGPQPDDAATDPTDGGVVLPPTDPFAGKLVRLVPLGNLVGSSGSYSANFDPPIKSPNVAVLALVARFAGVQLGAMTPVTASKQWTLLKESTTNVSVSVWAFTEANDVVGVNFGYAAQPTAVAGLLMEWKVARTTYTGAALMDTSALVSFPVQVPDPGATLGTVFLDVAGIASGSAGPGAPSAGFAEVAAPVISGQVMLEAIARVVTDTGDQNQAPTIPLASQSPWDSIAVKFDAR